MHIEGMPGCCTAAILYSFGEHGEKSEVNPERIKEFVASVAKPEYHGTELVSNAKRCIFAISVNPNNIRQLQTAGFKIRDKYEGIQGMVHILTLHD